VGGFAGSVGTGQGGPVPTVHIREVGGSSPSSPTYLSGTVLTEWFFVGTVGSRDRCPLWPGRVSAVGSLHGRKRKGIMRLDTVIEGYWLARERDFSPNTVNDYTLTFSRLITHLGAGIEFERITAGEIHGFLNSFDLAPKTLSNIWTALSSLWTWAAVELGTEHIIRGKVKRPHYKRAAIDPYTDEEVLALVDATASYVGLAGGRRVRARRDTAIRDRAIMLVMLDSGARVSELCALQIKDYQQGRGQLFVERGKGDKERFVYLGKGAQRALWRYLAERVGVRSDDPLFAVREGGKMDRDTVQKMIARAGQRAGVPGAGPHRFRHTFAISYIRNGGNLLALRMLLGHEKMETVRIYAKMAAADLVDGQRRASPVDKLGL